MRFQSLALATLTLVAAACGPRGDRDCGPHGLVYVEGMGCVCPAGTRFVCDEGTTVCICEPLDGGVPDAPFDAGEREDAPTDGGCTGLGEMMCGSDCVDTRTSATHCGGCDEACGSPMTCVAGACTDPFVDVELGFTHTCALRASGAVYCWGSNGDGQIGDGTTIERHVPTRVVDLDDAVQIVASGQNVLGRTNGESSCARRAGGTVVCWGWISGNESTSTPPSSRPLAVPGIADAVDVSLGIRHACAVRDDGTVACWGDNTHGLGDGTSGGFRATPVTVMGLTDATQVSCGWTHTCAVRETGAVVCWGDGDAGQLGRGPGGDSLVPVTASGLANAATVRGNSSSTCALDLGGAVYCWGDNAFGGLGRSDVGRTLTPMTFGPPRDFELLAHSLQLEVCGRRTSGAYMCWGASSEAPPRDGGIAARLMPTEIPEFAGATALAPSIGVDCTVADGSVLCRGANTFGQLGDNTTTNRAEFAPVADL